MPSILVQLDDATYKALNQMAPAAKRKRTEFIRTALKEAIRKREYADMREAYRKQPDSASESDSWSNLEGLFQGDAINPGASGATRPRYSGTLKAAMRLEIQVNVADDAADKVELAEHLRKEAILALFADRKITAGKAAGELGLVHCGDSSQARRPSKGRILATRRTLSHHP